MRQMPLFRSVSNETLRRVEQEAVQLSFSKGQEIITRADEIDDVYVLLKGLARVSVFSASGKSVNFRRVDPGDIFGEFAAIDGQRRSATIEVVEACKVLCISAKLFRKLMNSDPAFMNAVLLHLVTQLRALTSRVVEFSTLAVTNRIHSELLRMARSDRNGAAIYEISPAPTHSEIAGRISTHREAVSREISRLKQLGVIERRGRSLIVTDITRLERMVHDACGE